MFARCAAQKLFFKVNTKEHLLAAKKLEATIDRVLKAFAEPTMFDSGAKETDE